jgi:hypothetical protein
MSTYNVNLYGYVGNVPTTYVDPSGLLGSAFDPGGGPGGYVGGPFIGPVLPPVSGSEILTWIVIGGSLYPVYLYNDDALALLEGAGATASAVASSCWNFATKPFKGKDQRKGEKAEWAEAAKGLTKDQERQLHDQLREWKKAGGTVPVDDLVELRNALFPDNPYPGGWLERD